jgi:hypothetical protein
MILGDAQALPIQNCQCQGVLEKGVVSPMESAWLCQCECLLSESEKLSTNMEVFTHTPAWLPACSHSGASLGYINPIDCKPAWNVAVGFRTGHCQAGVMSNNHSWQISNKQIVVSP